MKGLKNQQARSSILKGLLVALVIVGLGAASWAAQKHENGSTITLNVSPAASQTTNRQASNPTPPVANWTTYHDTGYPAASGVSIKYPRDWEINIPGIGKFGNTNNPNAIIYERVVFLPSSETPKDEWNTCAVKTSADACGAAPGDQTLSGTELTINGLAAYTATMQNSNGTYLVTVIRSNKSTSPAGTPYAEFTTTSNDPVVLKSFRAVMAGATLPN